MEKLEGKKGFWSGSGVVSHRYASAGRFLGRPVGRNDDSRRSCIRSKQISLAFLGVFAPAMPLKPPNQIPQPRMPLSLKLQRVMRIRVLDHLLVV
jgi:hypothetical protein